MTVSDTYPPQLGVGVTRDRIAQVTPAARSLHRKILRAFASTGHEPDPAVLRETAAGQDVEALLRELHQHDVVRLREDGNIAVAYPFSAAPTVHLVAIAGGPTVYAMCAVDALGMAEMLGRDIEVTSTDPQSHEPVGVSIHNGQISWAPATTMVFVGSSNGAQSLPSCDAQGDTVGQPSAADCCCGVMNFFTSPASADRWLQDHPNVGGVVLTGPQAHRLGIDIFGRLLDE